MSDTDLLPTLFIAGYKHNPDQEEIHWLCNHPESIDLIFSKHKSAAFTFDDEPTALAAIKGILTAENHEWYTPVIENLAIENSTATSKNDDMSLEQTEEKIHEFLKLFNERSNSQLKLFLTANKKDNSIRGYGAGFKLSDEVINFVALLTIKGLKARCLDKHTFVVKID